MELTEQQKQVLQTAFDHFKEFGDWPKCSRVQRTLARRDPDVDVLHTLNDMPGGLATPGYVPPEHPVVVTVPGISLCQGAEDLLSDFARVVRYCADTYLDSDSEDVVYISAADLSGQLGFSDAPVLLIGAMMRTEPNILGSGSGGPNWRYEISDGVRHYRQIESIQQYLEVRQRLTKQAVSVQRVRSDFPVLNIPGPAAIQIPDSGAPAMQTRRVVPLDEAHALLSDQIRKGHEIESQAIGSEQDLKRAKIQADKWHDRNIRVLKYIFSDTSVADDYYPRNADMEPGVAVGWGPIEITRFQETVAKRIGKLEAVLESLDLIPEDRRLASALPDKTDEEAPIGAEEASRKGEPTVTNPRVFIGSSTEGLRIAKYLQLELEGRTECDLWTQGPFGLTEGTLESLVKATSQYDYAVLVLTPDDLTEKRQKKVNSPRDNVLFELGLFMGSLGRDHTFIVYCRDDPPNLPSDLAGVTAATFVKRENLRGALGAVCTQLEDAMGIL